MNPGSPAGASTGYGAVALSLKQRQCITGNAFSDDMLWGVTFQWTVSIGIRSTSMISQPTPLYAMSAQDCQMALSLLTAPDMFARFSARVEPDSISKIPIIIRDCHGIIPFQTRAPGTMPMKLQASADYKVACMIRDGTHKVRAYDPKI